MGVPLRPETSLSLTNLGNCSKVASEMSNRFGISALIAPVLATFIGITSMQPASAYGGFFCQNSPINQNAERIIFTQSHYSGTSKLRER